MTQPYPSHHCCRHHTRESVCREAASFKRASPETWSGSEFDDTALPPGRLPRNITRSVLGWAETRVVRLVSEAGIERALWLLRRSGEPTTREQEWGVQGSAGGARSGRHLCFFVRRLDSLNPMPPTFARSTTPASEATAYPVARFSTQALHWGICFFWSDHRLANQKF